MYLNKWLANVLQMGTVGNTVALQPEGPGFKSQTGSF